MLKDHFSHLQWEFRSKQPFEMLINLIAHDQNCLSLLLPGIHLANMI